MNAPARRAAPEPALVRALRDHRLGDDVPDAVWDRALVAPAIEFLSRPGKEVRARLCELGWRLAGGAGRAPDGLALVVEALHAGSLIVDDIEDDSDERRGAPALHRLIGTPLALNTGNWMYFWALALLGEAGLAADAHHRAIDAAVRTLLACHQGQALDLSVRIADLAMADVAPVVAATTRQKTGALMKLAAQLGAIAAGAPLADERVIARLGEAVGVALQMLDDLGSLCSAARAAKGREDLRAGRPTWPWAWLAGRAEPLRWARLAAAARAVIAGADDGAVDGLAEALRREIEPIGRAAIRQQLDVALADAAGLGDHVHPVLDALRAELALMEASYG